MTPTLVDRYFALAAAPDFDAYLAQFTDDAVAEDEGRRHEGIAAIRAWRAGVPPVSYTVKSVEPTAEGTRAVVEIAGDFPGSPVPLTFGFAFRGEKIRRLTIRPLPG
jgi:hypothetical protein